MGASVIADMAHNLLVPTQFVEIVAKPSVEIVGLNILNDAQSYHYRR